MKRRKSLFVLTVSLLLHSSNGEASFAGRRKHCTFSHDSFRCGSDLEIPSHSLGWDFAKLRGKKRARFCSPTRLVSTVTGARKAIQGSSSVRANSSQVPTFVKSYRGMGRSLLGRFRFPTASQETIQRLVSIFRYFLIGYIGLEVVLILRDVFEEVFFGSEDYHETRNIIRGSGKKDNSKKAFSRKSVDKLIAWLETPKEERPSPPSNSCPDWQISIAQELHECNLNPRFFRRILSQLTMAEADLLQKCLLSSSRKVEFSDIGGLFGAKKDITMELLSALKRFKNEFSPENKSSPYEEMIINDFRQNNLALWGPPGTGKTLLIRAIAKQFPTLVISPFMLQNHQQLETLFSLVSTIGPCFLVLDNLDILFPTRENGNNSIPIEIRAEFLRWWDTIISSKEPVFVVAATSHPWDIDTAAWGRFSNRVYVGLPNEQDRYHMLQIFSKDLPPIESNVLHHFARVTEGFLPMDVHEALVRICINGPMSRQDSSALTIQDIDAVLSTNALCTNISAQYAQRFMAFMRELSLSQSQMRQTSPMPDSQVSPQVIRTLPFGENGCCWETAIGNFYQLQIPVDSEVLDAIRTILAYSFELNSSEDWDINDEESDDDDFP